LKWLLSSREDVRRESQGRVAHTPDSFVVVVVAVTGHPPVSYQSYQSDKPSSRSYTTQAPFTTSWRGRGVIASTTLHDTTGSTRGGSSDRKPNMVATLLRDDTDHISLLSLGISSFLCWRSGCGCGCGCGVEDVDMICNGRVERALAPGILRRKF
jgi:hypothetical protein